MHTPRVRIAFLSTFPLRGTSCACLLRFQRLRHFYPRSPCGERRSRAPRPRRSIPISIHVPLAGNVDDFGYAFTRVKTFLSTFPLRGTSPTRGWLHTRRLGFLSTFPLRGTSAPAGQAARHDRKFLSTFPLRGTSLVCRVRHGIRAVISIHVPLAGNVLCLLLVGAFCHISIHVPLAGNVDFALHSPHRVLISIHVPLAGNVQYH